MLAKYLENINKIYNYVDSIIIINKEGIVEYSVIKNKELDSFTNDSFIGKHVFEVYPCLTEETSNHYRVMKSGQPIINETQVLEDLYGRCFTFVNSTFPIEYESQIIGTIEASILISRNDNLKEKKESVNKLYRPEDIVTINPTMIEIKDKIIKISNSESPVMIYGDTGTGKELVAQSIHSCSKRGNGPFISINCSAIPASILESILFGTEKGSFTGAENKKGLFELANKGTLFLDELNSMDITLQAKILKAIEENKIRPIGGEKVINLDVRYIAAMNIAPQDAMKSDALRKDLYFRLNVIQIHIPQLKKRPEDIDLLTQYFIGFYNRKMDKAISGASEIVRTTFNDYYWPGNVRELKNAIEYAFNVSDGEQITLKDIPENILYSNKTENGEQEPEVISNAPLNQMMDDYEKKIIINALSRSKNMSDAAKNLNITRQSLQYKMEKYNLKMVKSLIKE